MLWRILAVYDARVGRFSLACGPGCDACCTRSVTMTSLEGEVLGDFLQQAGRWPEMAATLREMGPSGIRPAETFNQFAALCLAQREPADDVSLTRDMAPCLLLDADGRCTVYPARPFACRSFASSCRCAADRGAEMAPLLVTLNTVVLQLIEHLDSDGGCWGNLIDILRLRDRPEENIGNEVLPARPLPGFLVPPWEEAEINAFLETLFRSTIQGRSFGRLLEDPGSGSADAWI